MIMAKVKKEEKKVVELSPEQLKINTEQAAAEKLKAAEDEAAEKLKAADDEAAEKLKIAEDEAAEKLKAAEDEALAVRTKAQEEAAQLKEAAELKVKAGLVKSEKLEKTTEKYANGKSYNVINTGAHNLNDSETKTTYVAKRTCVGVMTNWLRAQVNAELIKVLSEVKEDEEAK